MIPLTQQQIERLVQGKEMQVRVIVEEEDLSVYDNPITKHCGSKSTKNHPDIGWIYRPHKYRNGDTEFRIPFQVGKNYAVGKSRLWYCPNCNEFSECKDYFTSYGIHICKAGGKPLRFVIKSIKNQHLMDLTEKDARKYSDYKQVARKATLIDFYEANAKKHIPRDFIVREGLAWNVMKSLDKWNPEVWVFTGVKFK